MNVVCGVSVSGIEFWRFILLHQHACMKGLVLQKNAKRGLNTTPPHADRRVKNAGIFSFQGVTK